jgi:hypothetical protein
MNRLLILLVITPWLSFQTTTAQDVYSVSSSELLFQFADIENLNYSYIENRLRFTLLINYGQYWHVDFSNSLGIYTGLAIRNVGFIYDTPEPRKTIRRSYTTGIPLALKIGAFDKNMYIMAGGEYELLFHYRARRWQSNDRDGNVTKESGWFSDKTERFVPSVFAGVQFPGGVNLKFKYYLKGFLNEDYVGLDFGEMTDFSDFTKLDMFYISLCWQFRTDRIRDLTGVGEMASVF